MLATLFAFLSTFAQDPPPAPPVKTAPGPRPNLVLVTLDTVRADHLGCYGYPRPTTPTIDALAAESIVFERCYAPVPRTTPSHCSLLTGVYPFEHGITACSFRKSEKVQERLAFRSTPQLKSYAQILEANGWSTGGFVSAAVLKRITGLASGFQGWSEPEGAVRLGSETLTDALRWLDTAPEPFFLWVHLFDAHSPPRDQNQKYQRQFVFDDKLKAIMAERGIERTVKSRRAKGVTAAPGNTIVQYDSSIRMLDDYVLTLRQELEKRGYWPHTTFVLTADHGEGLGQHGYMSHGLVWNEQLRVPLMIHVPGGAPERLTKVMSSIDILATAIDLTPGLPRDEFFAQARGKDALAEGFEERPVFSMSPPNLGEYALTTSRWKYISRDNGERALFDLEKDPFELTDLKDTFADIATAFERQLLATIEDHEARGRYYAGDGADVALTPEEEAALRKELEALGYADDGAEGGDKKARKRRRDKDPDDDGDGDGG